MIAEKGYQPICPQSLFLFGFCPSQQDAETDKKTALHEPVESGWGNKNVKQNLMHKNLSLRMRHFQCPMTEKNNPANSIPPDLRHDTAERIRGRFGNSAHGQKQRAYAKPQTVPMANIPAVRRFSCSIPLSPTKTNTFLFWSRLRDRA